MGIFDSLFPNDRKKEAREVAKFTDELMTLREKKLKIFKSFYDPIILVNQLKGLTREEYLMFLDSFDVNYTWEPRVRWLKYDYSVTLPAEAQTYPRPLRANVYVTVNKNDTISHQTFAFESFNQGDAIRLFEFFKHFGLWDKVDLGHENDDMYEHPAKLESDDKMFRVTLTPLNNGRSVILQFV